MDAWVELGSCSVAMQDRGQQAPSSEHYRLLPAESGRPVPSIVGTPVHSMDLTLQASTWQLHHFLHDCSVHL